MTGDTETTVDAFDLHTTFVHLSVDARASALPDFSWAPEAMADYARSTRPACGTPPTCTSPATCSS